MKISPIEEAHWESIMDIQNHAYSEIDPESESVMKSKWILSPKSCVVALNDEAVLGYCLAHSWHESGAPPLYEEIKKVPEWDNLFLHDIAVASHARNMGVASALCNEVIGFAERQGLASLTLVAIQGARPIWSRFGFEVVSDFEVPSNYGNDAVFMKLTLC